MTKYFNESDDPGERFAQVTLDSMTSTKMIQKAIDLGLIQTNEKILEAIELALFTHYVNYFYNQAE